MSKNKNKANNFKIPTKKHIRNKFITSLAGEEYLKEADKINEEIRQINIDNSRAYSRANEDRCL